jgi:O-methyltransferase involved in polyketide biosynthesis
VRTLLPLSAAAGPARAAPRPAFLSWLGVTQYLTTEAIGQTLDVIGGFAAGTELVMEYLVPAELRDGAGQDVADFMPRAAASAEPWLTFLTPIEVAETLAARLVPGMRHVLAQDSQWIVLPVSREKPRKAGLYGGGGNRTRVRSRTGLNVYRCSSPFGLARTAGG